MSTLTPARKSAITKHMSPEEFKAEVHRRGWTYRALGERWDLSENWISKIARKEDRPMHWDDAVRGLPILKR